MCQAKEQKWESDRNKSRQGGNGIACKQATPRAALGFCSANRAENLCYQFYHGRKLPPQFRKIVGLVFLSGKIQNSPYHVEPVETSSRKAHILLILFATLDPSTALLATAMLAHRTYGFAFFKGVAM